MLKSIKFVNVTADLRIRLRRDARWHEYRVEVIRALSLNGTVVKTWCCDENETYFTSDKQDALDTMSEMVRVRAAIAFDQSVVARLGC